jgi:hypothetical protein
MKAQITKQHTNAVTVQPQTTFHKEDRMKKQTFTTLKLAVFFAMVITMALSAVAQDQEEVVGAPTPYQNPLQVALKEWYPANLSASLTGLYPGGGSFSSPGGVVFDGSNIWVTHVVASGPNKVDKLQASDGKFIATYTLTGSSNGPDPRALMESTSGA